MKMIFAVMQKGGKNMIKAEWTNADALNLQPTCNQLATDCISRQAALASLVKEYNRRFSLGERNGLKMAWIEKAVDDTPHIDVPRWIPVTEALPTTDDKVLCCTMTKKGVPGIVIGYYLRGEHGCSWACGMNSNVVAWMPLPEPYEVKP